jgi:hypothetical protein
MTIKRLPIIDKDLRDCEDLYFEIVQMIDEYDMFVSRVEEFYQSNMRYNSILSDNPSDCWESTLTDTQQAMCHEILEPSSEFIELFKIETIEEVYDMEDKSLLNKMHWIIKNVIDENMKMARYYICGIL